MGNETMRSFRRMAGGLALLCLAALPARAQTPEGTSITNSVSVTYQDVNGNSYAPAASSVTVTVGFAGGIDLTGPGAQAPASPSASNNYTLAAKNVGNGTDHVALSITGSVPAGMTITGYTVGATPYATLAALNTALATTDITAGSTLNIVVGYSIDAGQGGIAKTVTFVATSTRDATKHDDDVATITPTTSHGLSVTPDGGAVSQLPSNGHNYTYTFTVTNSGSAAETVDLTASWSSGAIGAIVSVNGTAGASAQIASLAAGASATVDVIYSIGNVTAGTAEDLRLKAASNAVPATNDLGSITVTVVKASVQLTKEAYLSDKTTLIGAADRVLPGQAIAYKITVHNPSATDALSAISITDALPTQVTFVGSDADAAGWTLGEAAGTVTATLVSLAANETRFFWVRVTVK